MQEQLLIIGIVLIFLGVLVTVIASILSGSGKAEFGVIGFIGPFPIGLASSKRMLYVVMGFSLVVLILFFLTKKLI